MAAPPLAGKPLVQAAYRLLMQDSSMIALLFAGGLASGATFALIALPASMVLGTSVSTNGSPVSVAVYALALFASTFVSTFFTGAVVAAAMMRADGQDPDVRTAMAVAWSRRGPLLAWAGFATIVGIGLRLLERWGLAGALVRVLAGVAWTLATWFAVPVIIAEGTMPIETVQRSAQILKERFGTNVRATVRLGFQWVLATIGLVLVAAFGVVVLVSGTSRHQSVGVLIGALIVVLAVAGLFLASAVWSAVGAYLRTVLYRYATGQPIPGIDARALPPLLPVAMRAPGFDAYGQPPAPGFGGPAYGGPGYPAAPMFPAPPAYSPAPASPTPTYPVAPVQPQAPAAPPAAYPPPPGYAPPAYPPPPGYAPPTYPPA